MNEGLSLWLRLLRTDRVLQMCLVGFGAALVYLGVSPGDPDGGLAGFPNLVDSVALGLILLALLCGRSHLLAGERLFTDLLAAAWACWLLADLFFFLGPALRFVPPSFVTDGLQTLFYFVLALALDLRPYAAQEGSRTALRHRIESAAGLAAVFGLLTYFSLVNLPAPLGLSLDFVPRERGLTFWLLGRLSLDLLVLARLTYSTLVAKGKWSAVYGLLTLAFLCYGLKHALALLQYRGSISFSRPFLYEAFLLLPALLVVLAARYRQFTAGEISEPHLEAGERSEAALMRPSPVALYALVVPGLHFVLYPLGLLDAETRAAREVFSLIYIGVLGGVAWVHARAVAKEAARARDALRETEQKLFRSQRLEAVGRLAGGIAHDFNNYLTVIQGYGSLLRPRLDGPQQLADLSFVEDAAAKATHLTQQLLAFGRRQVLRPEPLEVNKVVLETTKLLDSLLGEDVVLEVHLEPEVGLARADLGQTEQVLMNLALNARDSMPGGGTLKISTERVVLGEPDAAELLVEAGSYVRLVVSDTGCGMSEEVRSRVFEPFFTTKGATGGTGLGLSTVYGIVAQTGGAISLESAPGKGTTVSVLLPSADASPELEVVPLPQAATPRASATVLLIEDQEEVRSLSARVLREEGFLVIEAEGGREALGRFTDDSEPLDLLVTDVVMPGIDGVEVAEALGSRFPGLPVLFVSGYPTQTLRERHANLPRSFPLLEKPFTPTALVAAVRRTLLDNPRRESPGAGSGLEGA